MKDVSNDLIMALSAESVISNVMSLYSIESPVFILTTPNGGESYYPASKVTIRWYDAFVGSKVTLEYSIDNGTSWLPIVSNYINNDINNIKNILFFKSFLNFLKNSTSGLQIKITFYN